MNNSTRILAAITAAACILAGSLFLYKHALNKRQPAGDPVVAMVDSTVIRKSNLKVLSPPVPSDQALALLVDFQLIDVAAGKKNITVSEAELQQQRQDVTTGQNAKSYAEAAQKFYRSPSGLDLQLRHALLLEKLSALELKPVPKGMFHARGIEVTSSGKHAKSMAQALAYAQKLQREIAAGADIARIAKLNSDDNISAPSGGDLGIIQLSGAPNLVRVAPDFKLQRALASAVKTAVPGSFLGGPIRGYYGYWVVQVVSTDKKPGADEPRYEDIDSAWRNSWIARLEPGVMARLRSHAFIQPPLLTPAQQNRS